MKKNIFSIALLVLAFSLLSATSVHAEDPLCEDSDNGITKDKAGTVESTDANKVTEKKEDSCDGDVLLEVFCKSDGTIGIEDYKCDFGCKEGACLPAPTECVDTDGGKKYTKSGVAEGFDAAGKEARAEDQCILTDSTGSKYVDSCEGEGCGVEEAYCDGSLVKVYSPNGKGVDCEYGCKEGACIEKDDDKKTDETHKCVDTDEGDDVYHQGKTYLEWENGEMTAKSHDTCLNDEAVLEHWCKEGEIKKDDIACPYGCKDGACLKSANMKKTNKEEEYTTLEVRVTDVDSGKNLGGATVIVLKMDGFTSGDVHETDAGMVKGNPGIATTAEATSVPDVTGAMTGDDKPIELVGPPGFDGDELCKEAGGEWKELPDGCVDSCEKARGNPVCTAAVTMGCDCGPEMCWNGEKCEPNEPLQGADPIFCPEDLKQCPDGSYVTRDADNNCEFFACDDTPIACPEDARTCPDGTTVVRVPPHCEFQACSTPSAPFLKTVKIMSAGGSKAKLESGMYFVQVVHVGYGVHFEPLLVTDNSEEHKLEVMLSKHRSIAGAADLFNLPTIDLAPQALPDHGVSFTIDALDDDVETEREIVIKPDKQTDEVKIVSQGVEATVKDEFDPKIDNGKLKVLEEVVKVLPEEIEGLLKDREAQVKEIEIERNSNGDVRYKVKIEAPVRILGFIPAGLVDGQAEINPTTGEIETFEKDTSAFGFLAV